MVQKIATGFQGIVAEGDGGKNNYSAFSDQDCFWHPPGENCSWNSKFWNNPGSTCGKNGCAEDHTMNYNSGGASSEDENLHRHGAARLASVYYDAETLSMVAEMYKSDFELLGYPTTWT